MPFAKVLLILVITMLLISFKIQFSFGDGEYWFYIPILAFVQEVSPIRYIVESARSIETVASSDECIPVPEIHQAGVETLEIVKNSVIEIGSLINELHMAVSAKTHAICDKNLEESQSNGMSIKNMMHYLNPKPESHQETKDQIEDLENLAVKLNQTHIEFVSGSRNRLDSNGNLVIKDILNNVRVIVRDTLSILDKLTSYNCELLELLHTIILEFKGSIPSNPCNGVPFCCTVENPCDVNEGGCLPRNSDTCKKGLFCDNDR